MPDDHNESLGELAQLVRWLMVRSTTSRQPDQVRRDRVAIAVPVGLDRIRNLPDLFFLGQSAYRNAEACIQWFSDNSRREAVQSRPPVRFCEPYVCASSNESSFDDR